MEGISLEELWREVREFVWKVSALLGSRIARPPSPAAILEILPLGFLFRLTLIRVFNERHPFTPIQDNPPSFVINRISFMPK